MDNIKSVLRIFEHINYILTSHQKRSSIVVFISMVFCSLLELLGVSAVYPFLMLMMDESGMRDKVYVSWIYKFYPDITSVEVIILLGIGVAIIYVIKNALSIACNYIQASYSARINRELAVKMLKSYMMRPYEFFVDTHSSIILRGLQGDISSVYSIILNGFQTLAEALTIIMIVSYLIKVDIFVALVSVIAGGLCFFTITLGFKGIMKRMGALSRTLGATINGFSYQIVTGIKEISVLDRKESFVNTFESYSRDNEKIVKKTQIISAMPDRIIEAACVVIVMTVLCIKIKHGVEMRTFIPTLGAFVMGIFRIMPSVAKISSRINLIVYCMPGLENAYTNMKEADKLEIEYLHEEDRLKKQISDHRYDIKKFETEIRVSDIHWKYKNGVDEVLRGLSIVIKRGESIGLIGSSGGGKSTLVDILMTLFKPQRGSVTMDGIDIFLMKYRWRRLIGYVPQSVFLTGGSVRSNVAFGLPDDKISDTKVWKALEQAQLKEYIDSLPDKLETVVGESGIKLSGGQRQRIAIARALYDEPEILILDEATAALDNDTENALMEAIETLQGEKTIIIVAHRLTTLRNCNRVYEIRDGKAIERDVREVVLGHKYDEQYDKENKCNK